MADTRKHPILQRDQSNASAVLDRGPTRTSTAELESQRPRSDLVAPGQDNNGTSMEDQLMQLIVSAAGAEQPQPNIGVQVLQNLAGSNLAQMSPAGGAVLDLILGLTGNPSPNMMPRGGGRGSGGTPKAPLDILLGRLGALGGIKQKNASAESSEASAASSLATAASTREKMRISSLIPDNVQVMMKTLPLAEFDWKQKQDSIDNNYQAANYEIARAQLDQSIESSRGLQAERAARGKREEARGKRDDVRLGLEKARLDLMSNNIALELHKLETADPEFKQTLDVFRTLGPDEKKAAAPRVAQMLLEKNGIDLGLIPDGPGYLTKIAVALIPSLGAVLMDSPPPVRADTTRGASSSPSGTSSPTAPAGSARPRDLMDDLIDKAKR